MNGSKSSQPDAEPGGTSTSDLQRNQKRIALAAWAIVFGIMLYLSRGWLSLEFFVQQETKLQSLLQAYPVLVFAGAFVIYVLVAGLSIPGGATVLSLIYAWLFKFWAALVLISFASTVGATAAFLISRYFLRDAVQIRFGKRLTKINESFDREGAFYLFTLRLIPAVPFFATNLLMGLTTIKVTTYWWVSQIGMLAGTAVYVYAGASIPDLPTLHAEGISAVFSPSQILKFTIAFTLLGCFPIAAKKMINWIRKPEQ